MLIGPTCKFGKDVEAEINKIPLTNYVLSWRITDLSKNIVENVQQKFDS